MRNLLFLDNGKFVEDEYVVQKSIPIETIYFEGHYPGNPIFPGVLQLQLASVAAEKLLMEIGKGGVSLLKVAKFRFLRAVLPGEIITIKVKIKEEVKFGWSVSVDLHVGMNRVSTGVLIMGDGTVNIPSEEILAVPEFKGQEQKFGVSDIIKILPHRYPFLQVDGVIDIVPGQKIITCKNVSASDYMLWGRGTGASFPRPILIEALAQSAVMIHLQAAEISGVVLFGSMINATFTNDVYPGEQLVMEAFIVKSLSNGGIVSGSMWVQERLVCEVENLIFAVR